MKGKWALPLFIWRGAIQWLQWYETTKPIVGWEEFSSDLCKRFGKRHKESVVGELTKLKQTSTVEVYHDKFEELINRNKELSESFLVDCFISGLKDEIKKAVNMFDPLTLNRAFCLAQLQEDTVEALTKKSSYSYKSNSKSLLILLLNQPPLLYQTIFFFHCSDQENNPRGDGNQKSPRLVL